MLKKVVPEKIIPQNIADFLVDENAELAEPDAYTFLTRLRGLGVGSADFIYLLEGCGAPKEAVIKIKSNPAMNLQTLILTLDNSGMTSKDYMRILYTARQIWEKTLTTRLETAEAVVDSSAVNDASENSIEDIDNAVEADDAFDKEDEFRAALEALNAETERALREQAESQSKTVSSGEDIPHTDDVHEISELTADSEAEAVSSEVSDIHEQSAAVYGESDEQSINTIGFALGGTEEFESLLGVSASEDYAQPVKPKIEDEDFECFGFEKAIADSDAVVDEHIEENNVIPSSAEDEFIKENKHFIIQIDYSAEEAADDTPNEFVIDENSSFFDMDDDQATEDHAADEAAASSVYNGDTTAIVAIDRAMLEENLANMARNASSDEQEVSDGTDDTQSENNPHDKFEVIIPDEVNDEYDEDYDYINSRSHYYGGALAASAVGATIVFGVGIMAGFAFGMTPPDPIDYAADGQEIFTEIYYSYTEKIAGGDSYYGYSLQNVDIFGDLLITQDGFSTFTDGDKVYSLTSEEISVNRFADGELEFVGTISAPENTDIVDAVQLENGAITAVFDGDACGYMLVSGGTLAYTVRQDGHLTDFSVENNEIRLGSVYTPKFYQNFTASDTEVYLPKLGTEYVAMSPQSVIPCRMRGYSYGVSAAYSAESGNTLRADAVLGNPVYASGDGYFALNGTEAGLLVRVDYTEANEETVPTVTTAECGRLSDIAFFEGGSAAMESGKITLRDKDFKAVTILENFSSIPEKMAFRGNTLIVSDKNKVFLAMDCTDLTNPLALTLRNAVGSIGKDSAVIMEQTAEGIRIAEYTLGDDGNTAIRKSNVIPLSGEQRGTLKFGNAASIVTNGTINGAAYCYFDGVSVIWEFTALTDSPKRAMLYDDKTGITLAFPMNGKIYVQSARGLIEMS